MYPQNDVHTSEDILTKMIKTFLLSSTYLDSKKVRILLVIWCAMAERFSASDLCSDGRVFRMWVRILAATMVFMSLSNTLYHNCFSSPRRAEPSNCVWLSSLRYTFGSMGVSWPGGLAYRTQVLVLAAECGFESRPWHLCPWARHLIIIASLHPGVKWVPVRAELVD